MVRFLNLKNQIEQETPSFAFYNTITDTIITFWGEQVFDSLEDFVYAYELA